MVNWSTIKQMDVNQFRALFETDINWLFLQILPSFRGVLFAALLYNNDFPQSNAGWKPW
jgi:hypothetical protein